MQFDENDVMKMVSAFKEGLEAYKKEVDDLKKMIYEDFLGPAEENFKSWDHTTRLGEFKDKYKDTITDELCSKCKEAEGDESFDLADKIFSDYDALEDKIPEDEYVATVVASLTEQLNKLKETLNAEEIKVETETNEEGETVVEVEADGEQVAEATEVAEEKVDNVQEEDEETAFMKELENAKVDKSKWY